MDVLTILLGRAPFCMVAVLRGDGNSRLDDWQLHHIQSGEKRRKAGVGAQAFLRQGQQDLQEI